MLCSNGCGRDIGVKDGRIVGVRGREKGSREFTATLGQRDYTQRSTLVTGRLEIVAVQGPLLAYQIMDHEEKYMIVLDFSNERQMLERDQAFAARVCLATFFDKDNETIQTRIEVRGNEGLILLPQPEKPQ